MLRFEATKEQQKKIFNLFSEYNNARPEPDRNLDQFRATKETVLQRAVLLGNIPKISEKQLIFLGDNDLTSVAFSSLFEAKKITVVDVDTRILQFIRTIAREKELPIEIFEHNLRNPLPKELKRYDVAFFDPPFTPEAANAWFVRAMEATLSGGSNWIRKKPETLSSKYYFLCYGYTDRETERGLKIQKIITSLGLLIQEKIRDFNHYHGAKSIKSKSDLFLIKPTPQADMRKLDIARSQFYTGKKKPKSKHKNHD